MPMTEKFRILFIFEILLFALPVGLVSGLMFQSAIKMAADNLWAGDYLLPFMVFSGGAAGIWATIKLMFSVFHSRKNKCPMITLSYLLFWATTWLIFLWYAATDFTYWIAGIFPFFVIFHLLYLDRQTFIEALNKPLN